MTKLRTWLKGGSKFSGFSAIDQNLFFITLLKYQSAGCTVCYLLQILNLRVKLLELLFFYFVSKEGKEWFTYFKKFLWKKLGAMAQFRYTTSELASSAIFTINSPPPFQTSRFFIILYKIQ